MKPDTFTARVSAIVALVALPPVTAAEDTINHRLTIQFAIEPPHDIKQLLIESGWSYRGGSTNAWVRKVSGHGKQSQRLLMAQLTERTEEDNL